MKWDKKLIFKGIIVLVCLIILIVALFVIKTSKAADYKVFKNKDFVIEEKTEYEKEYFSGIPFININTDDVKKLNKEIANIYYGLAVSNDTQAFSYDYVVYNDVLILFVKTIKYDDSEYGKIDYYSYYIDLVDFKVLSNDEFLRKIKVSSREVNDNFDLILKKYYKNDSYSQSMTFNEYKDLLLKDKNYAYFINDDTLYLYVNLDYTKDLVESNKFGNIYEFKIVELKKSQN